VAGTSSLTVARPSQIISTIVDNKLGDDDQILARPSQIISTIVDKVDLKRLKQG
jgi:hypothetical protein